MSLNDSSPTAAPKPPRPPVVSVIIPVFNASAHIVAALQSVFAQSFTDYEVIVINDGSHDTELMERAIQPFLRRITYLKQQNCGPSSARNLGIRQARGEWIAFLDSDDVWLPQYLTEQMRFLHQDPALDMVYCDSVLDGQTNAVGKTYMQVCPSTGPVTFESLLTEQTQVNTSGTVVRREKVVAAGLFDEEIRYSEDHDLWLRIAYAGGRISYQREALLRRNVRAGSQGAASQNLLAGEIQTLRKLQRDLALDPDRRALLTRRLRQIEAALAFTEGKQFLLAGECDKAYESLTRANALVPNPKLRAMLAALRIAPRFTIYSARLWRQRTPR